MKLIWCESSLRLFDVFARAHWNRLSAEFRRMEWGLWLNFLQRLFAIVPDEGEILRLAADLNCWYQVFCCVVFDVVVLFGNLIEARSYAHLTFLRYLTNHGVIINRPRRLMNVNPPESLRAHKRRTLQILITAIRVFLVHVRCRAPLALQLHRIILQSFTLVVCMRWWVEWACQSWDWGQLLKIKSLLLFLALPGNFEVLRVVIGAWQSF